MAIVNIVNRHLNNQKREAEAIVVTVPAIAQENGGRVMTPPVYYQYGDTLVGPTIGPNTIIQKAYLVVREAFPTGATATVKVGNTEVFTDLAIDAKVVSVSTHEDMFSEVGMGIEVVISGGTGDITVGEFEVVLEILSCNIKKGSYIE